MKKNSEIEIKLMPINETVSIKSGMDVYNGLKEKGIFLKSKCGGSASCADCVVQILNGEQFLNDISFEETRLLGNIFHITKERLSCQLKPTSNITIDVKDHLDHINEKRVVTNKTVRRKKDEKPIKEYKEKVIKESGFKKPKAFRFNDK